MNSKRGYPPDTLIVLKRPQGWHVFLNGFELEGPMPDMGAALRSARSLARLKQLDIGVYEGPRLVGFVKSRDDFSGSTVRSFPIRLLWSGGRPPEPCNVLTLSDPLPWRDLTRDSEGEGRLVLFDALDERDSEGRWLYRERTESSESRGNWPPSSERVM